jgi:hypothetical protein
MDAQLWQLLVWAALGMRLDFKRLTTVVFVIAHSLGCVLAWMLSHVRLGIVATYQWS